MLIPGRSYTTHFYTGRLSSEVQHLTLLYTICDRRGTPFVYQSNDKKYPFHIPSLERWCSFNCCKCTVFSIWINVTKPGSSLSLSHPWNASVTLFGPFRDRNDIFCLTFCLIDWVFFYWRHDIDWSVLLTSHHVPAPLSYKWESSIGFWVRD